MFCEAIDLLLDWNLIHRHKKTTGMTEGAG